MAMTTCRECSREVSTEAAACPHCGARHPYEERAREAAVNQLGIKAAAALLALALGVVLLWFGAQWLTDAM